MWQTLRSFWLTLYGKAPARPARRRPAFRRPSLRPCPQAVRRPILEHLEDRLAPATLTVNSTDDNITDTTVMTLRAAVNLIDSGGTSVAAPGAPAVAPADAQTVFTGSYGTGDTIQFDPNVFGSTPQAITLGGTELLLSSNVIINGPGANELAISGNNQSRVFEINTPDLAAIIVPTLGVPQNSNVTAVISGLTIENGNSDDYGGGIHNNGTLTLSDCTVSGNSSFQTTFGGSPGLENFDRLTVNNCTFSDNIGANGGGVANYYGTGTITNSTFSGNYASNAGGAIFEYGTATSPDPLTLTNCTLSGNSAGVFGGGLLNYSGELIVGNTIIAGNNALNGPDFWGSPATSNGHNLLGNNSNLHGGPTGFGGGGDQVGTAASPIDPGLAPLGNYGGPTQTMPPLPGSPAIGAGSGTLAVDANGQPLAHDQRGYLRPSSGPIDIGAVEDDESTEMPPTVQVTSPTAGSVPNQVVLTLTASDPDSADQAAGFLCNLAWGDGTVQTITASNGSGVAVSHTYAAPGIDTVSVSATAIQDGSVSSEATALVVLSSQPGDSIAVSGGSSAGQVALNTAGEGSLTTTGTPVQVLIVGSGGSDTYTVNFGSNLTTPIVLAGGGATSGDTLIVNGDSSSTNVINKTPGQVTWGSPVTETVYRSGIPNTTINANGTSQNYVNDPGSNTIINGGPGTNTITITATTGNGVVINGGPHANNYVITMGNLLGPVTINSTAGTSTVTVYGPPGSNVLTLTPTQLTGAGQTINFNLGSTATNFTVDGSAGNDELLVQGTPPGPLTARHVAPTVSTITAPSAPVALTTTISASAPFSELDGSIVTAVWAWGDGTTSAGTVTQTGTSGAVSGSHTYAADGVYTVTLTVTNPNQQSGQSQYQYVVVYNPSAGFVTGGGWITSPAGAYPANPALTGPANFGFDVKYHQGDTMPTGDLEFLFPAANLNFHSTGFDWLVVNGNVAQFQGSGTINGAGNYGFLVTVLDGRPAPSKIRIQIWDKSHGNDILFDTQLGAPETGADGTPLLPTTLLGGGNITVHPG
jgi:hypothetical protein